MHKGGIVTLLVTAVLASGAWALPITVDGNMDAGDNYFFTLVDADEPEISQDLDIYQIGFDRDDDWFYMGLETFEPISTTGSSSSVFGRVGVYMTLADGLEHSVELVIEDATVIRVLFDDVALSPAEYLVGIGDGIELALASSLINMDTFAFIVQLDDFGTQSDDQIIGQAVGIPEPTTLAVLSLGTLALIRRRR